jgi:hypothetical protein
MLEKSILASYYGLETIYRWLTDDIVTLDSKFLLGGPENEVNAATRKHTDRRIHPEKYLHSGLKPSTLHCQTILRYVDQDSSYANETLAIFAKHGESHVDLTIRSANAIRRIFNMQK